MFSPMVAILVVSSRCTSRPLSGNGAAVTAGDHADQAFGRDAAGLLGGGRQALGAQPVDRLFEVALDFAQRLLAIHHARAGLLAQFLDQGCSDLSHVLLRLCTCRCNWGRSSDRPRSILEDRAPAYSAGVA